MQLKGHMELEQADSTSWMGMYALNMMDMAIEIALHDDSFEDTATKFFEHFVLIAEAMNELGMWNDEDKFYYDTLAIVDANPIQLRIKSIVGLTAIFAVSVIETGVLSKLDDFDSLVWDFIYKGRALTLHYNIYTGISIYPHKFREAPRRDNDAVVEVAQFLETKLMINTAKKYLS